MADYTQKAKAILDSLDADSQQLPGQLRALQDRAQLLWEKLKASYQSEHYLRWALSNTAGVYVFSNFYSNFWLFFGKL